MTDELENKPESEEDNITDVVNTTLIITFVFVILDGCVGGFSGTWIGSSVFILILAYLLVKKFGVEKSKYLPPLIFGGLVLVVTVLLAMDANESVHAHPHNAKYIIGEIIMGGVLSFFSFMCSKKIKTLNQQNAV